MENDIYYPEKVFNKSFTFGNWLPLTCADVLHLQTFEEIYGRASLPKYSIYKSNGPFFFRNHPINYVVVTGKCRNGYEVSIENSKSSIVLIMFLDDGSGQNLKCSKFICKGAYKISELMGQTFEVQGYIVDHPTFGREIRILQFCAVDSTATEVENWADALKLRKEVLSKHWTYDHEGKQSTLAVTVKSQPVLPYTQEDENLWRLGSLAPIDHIPTAFCSFMRSNTILSQKNSIIESELGITLNPNVLNKCSSSAQVGSSTNMNILYYSESYRELTPELHNKIPVSITITGKIRKLGSSKNLKKKKNLVSTMSLKKHKPKTSTQNNSNV